MKLTKYGHACVRFDKGHHSLVVDPGKLTPEPGLLDGVETILITHEHFDHFDPERLAMAVAENPSITIYTCHGVAQHLESLPSRVHVVSHGETLAVPGFDVRVVGTKHHRIHPDVPPIENVGFLIDGEVFHPGDALTVTNAPTLLVPGQAPWLNQIDLLTYIRAVRARRVYAIHDGLLNDWGLHMLDHLLQSEAELQGAEIRRPAKGESIEV